MDDNDPMLVSDSGHDLAPIIAAARAASSPCWPILDLRAMSPDEREQFLAAPTQEQLGMTLRVGSMTRHERRRLMDRG